MPCTGRRKRLQQSGAALLVALFMLVTVLLLGISAARMALQGEKAARGERDRHIAFQAAEEALMDAENDIEGSPAFPGRSAMFAPDSALGFADGCGAGDASPNLGLCLHALDGAAPVWQSVDFSDEGSATVRSVPFGKFTGAVMQTGEGFLPFKRPRYIIELVPYTQEGEDAGPQRSYFYRVTAIGFGSSENTEVVLQSFYRKPPPHGGTR
ncbi:MAG TPA: PilX N-terminal domain-containing pilus assembly protein [Janthinobacterium sp.]|jgi:type IV pilus assembly protein PilX|nr:PilX N-terminal domain-containing pilus assembly protein [Janthinobacterium sp.]